MTCKKDRIPVVMHYSEMFKQATLVFEFDNGSFVIVFFLLLMFTDVFVLWGIINLYVYLHFMTIFL